jgi:hypothetical protein
MSSHHVVLDVVVTLAFAFSCWLIFWTKSAVKFSQSLKKSLRSRLAFEPWYPLFLRFEGIWLLVMMAFVLSDRA